MTTKQLNLWKSGAVQITGRAEQVHEWRALPPLLLPQLSISVFFCVFALQCKIYIPLLLLLCMNRSGRSRVKTEQGISWHYPLLMPLLQLSFLCISFLLLLLLLLLLLCIRWQSRVPAGAHCPLQESLYNFLFCFYSFLWFLLLLCIRRSGRAEGQLEGIALFLRPSTTFFFTTTTG